MSAVIGRSICRGLVAFAGLAALHGQSEGLIRFPALAIRASSFAAAAAAPEAHSAPLEDLEPIDVGLIDEASETIDMAVTC